MSKDGVFFVFISEQVMSDSFDAVVNKSKDGVFFVFISEQVMSDSSDSTNCVMSNSDYSPDGVVNKSKEEVLFVFINFKSFFYKFVHNFICHGIKLFISEYGMTESSNSTDCVMSNSGYSSDGVVNKSKDEIFFSFFTIVFDQGVCNFHGQIFAEVLFVFISEQVMSDSSN